MNARVAAGPDGTKGFAVKRQRLWTMNVKPPPLEMPVGEVTVADRLVRRQPLPLSCGYVGPTVRLLSTTSRSVPLSGSGLKS